MTFYASLVPMDSVWIPKIAPVSRPIRVDPPAVTLRNAPHVMPTVPCVIRLLIRALNATTALLTTWEHSFNQSYHFLKCSLTMAWFLIIHDASLRIDKIASPWTRKGHATNVLHTRSYRRASAFSRPTTSSVVCSSMLPKTNVYVYQVSKISLHPKMSQVRV